MLLGHVLLIFVNIFVDRTGRKEEDTKETFLPPKSSSCHTRSRRAERPSSRSQ